MTTTNQSDSTRAKSISSNRFGRIFAYGTGFLFVLVIIVVILFRTKTEPKVTDKPVSETRRSLIADFEPSAGPVSSDSVTTTTEEAVVDPRNLPDPMYNKKLNPALPPKKYIPTVAEVEKARLGPDGKPKVMSIYKTPVEQAMGVIFTTELGSPVPMLPCIPQCTSKEQLEDFLTRIFACDEDASEEVKENRKILQEVQNELAEYLDQGGDIGGFIDFYVGELRACHEQWKTAQRILVDMARAGEDPATLRKFRDGANELLTSKGIKPLTFPPSIRAAMGE